MYIYRMLKYFISILAISLFYSHSALSDDKSPEIIALDCGGCHRENGGEFHGKSAPILDGMNETYLFEQLKAFSIGKRSHPLMNYVTGGYSKSELSAIARYYAHLPKK